MTQLNSPCRSFFAALAIASLAFWPTALLAGANDRQIVVFGDSLVAGLGLGEMQAFPAMLQQALRERGYEIEIVNGGVSGDTTAAGLARLDWTVADTAAGVVLALGANDMLRGVDPALTRANLEAMILRLKQRRIPVLLTGMRAAPNLGKHYAESFEPLFPALASQHALAFYPFFLDGVAGEPTLNQNDGMHPNAAGVSVMVERFLPAMEAFLKRVEANEATK